MILDSFKLTGKVAIVTGCSRGLGQGMALGLAEAGRRSSGWLRAAWRLREWVSKPSAENSSGSRLIFRPSKPIDEIVNKTIARFGKIDILINSAGIIRRAEAVDFTEKDWDDVLNVNLKSLFFLSQAVARRFIAQQTGGKIINVASLLSFQGGIRVPSYTASKSGVMGLTRILACEWAKHNINVNAIAPGYMATDITAPLRADPVRNSEILARIPAGRWGLPEDLKGIAVFLASEASNYLNGFTIAVDGGWLAR